MAEKPEVVVRKVNLSEIKHIEADLLISLNELKFNVDTEEEF